MRCYSGIQTKNGLVPCGQCIACRVNKGRNWSARILLEDAFTPGRTWFITWTYDQDNIPITGENGKYVQTLRKRRLQNFLQNTKREIGPFRFYAVGEYGDDTLRPHYHLAAFCRHDTTAWSLAESWKKGNHTISPLTPGRARYLAGYTVKKLTSGTDERLHANQEPEFRISSRQPPIGSASIGPIVASYSSGTGQKLIESRGDIDRTIRLGGKVYPIPRYLQEKIRQELGIPARHDERLGHPEYYARRGQEEWADQNPHKRQVMEWREHAKKTAKAARLGAAKL